MAHFWQSAAYFLVNVAYFDDRLQQSKNRLLKVLDARSKIVPLILDGKLRNESNGLIFAG